MDDLEDDLNNRYDEDFEEEVTFFIYFYSFNKLLFFLHLLNFSMFATRQFLTKFV